MKFIIGKKLDMTEVWKGEEVVAVTRIQAGPCPVVQVKTEDNDRYSAVQLGYGEKKEKNLRKPQIGHLRGLGNLRHLREFRTETEGIKRGDIITVNTFVPGDIVQVAGLSKGKGFQGVVRRHGFSGAKKTHGTKDQVRMPGSIGATGPAHVFKGTRMAGQMGGGMITTKNLEIVEIDAENNLLLVKGAVPGARNGLILISGEGELKAEAIIPKEEKPEVKSGDTRTETVTPAPAEEKAGKGNQDIR